MCFWNQMCLRYLFTLSMSMKRSSLIALTAVKKTYNMDKNTDINNIASHHTAIEMTSMNINPIEHTVKKSSVEKESDTQISGPQLGVGIQSGWITGDSILRMTWTLCAFWCSAAIFVCLVYGMQVCLIVECGMCISLVDFSIFMYVCCFLPLHSLIWNPRLQGNLQFRVAG